MEGKYLTSLAAVQTSQQYRSERISNALKRLQNISTDKDDSRLRSACMEMESLFITHLLKEMRATVDKSGFISGGRSEEIFTSLLDVELSKKMSAAGGIGLSSMLMEQLSGKAAKTKGTDSQ